MSKREVKGSLIEDLKQTELYRSKILPDIKKCIVFPAIRNEWIGFYHKNGKLFQFDNDGFRTNVKYASVFRAGSDGDVLESDLPKLKVIENFRAGYENIKKLCAEYAGVEAEGVSEIYKDHSYAKEGETPNIVLLDIEVSFPSKRGKRSSDFIDLLLFDKENNRLIFCEAKHYSNRELWASKPENIKVVKQIKRYKDQIKGREKTIIKDYIDYVKIANKLFAISLPEPKEVCLEVPLLVFGFDKAQLKGERFQALFRDAIDKTIPHYPIGKVANIKLQTFIKKCIS